MRRPGAALLALLLLIGLVALTPARPADAQTSQTFVANTGQADGSASGLSSDLGQAFTTGSNSAGYSLRSVDVEFSAIDSALNPSHLTVGIYTESNGLPGSSLGTLTNPASFPASTSDQTLTFTSTGIDLDASTTYFLLIDTSSDNTGTAIRGTASNSEDSGALDGWSIGDRDVSRAWDSTGGFSLGTSALKISLGGISKTLLVSNFGQANTATGSFQAHDHAQAFTTGGHADGYTVTAVEFSFPVITAGDLAAKLRATVHSDSSGNPGAKVADLTVPGTIASGTNSFTHAGLQLDPDTTYWVVLAGIGNAPAGTNNIQNTASDAEDAGGAEGWSISDTALYRNRGGGSWTSFSQSRKINITGEVNALTRNLDGSYTVPFDWPLKPPGLGGGSTFRLLFITDDWRDATSTSIDDYDTFVRDAAREGHAAIRPYADQFRVVGSTAAVDARDHTRTNPQNAAHPDVSIWWLNGQRVAQSNAGFWSDTWEHWAQSDRRFESGAPDTESDWPWTGTLTNGTKHSVQHLGITGAGGPVVRGRFWTTSGDTGPIQHQSVGKSQEHAFYGISPVFRVASTLNAPPQEPAVLSNLGEADGAAVLVSFRPEELGVLHQVIDRAQSFTTGTNGGHYRLNSVDIVFAQFGEPDLNGFDTDILVQILADSGGAPDRTRVIAALANPAIQVSSTDRTYTFTYAGEGSGLRLEPSTTYWVLIRDEFSTLGGTTRLRTTASNSERIQGLPAGWSIGDNHRHWMISLPNPATSWSTHAEALKIGLNLGAAEPFVQFRTCAGTVSGNSCDTGWVVANYTRHDPPPTITLTEGGPVVTYQWRPVDPQQRRHFYVTDQVTEPLSTFGGYIGAGGPDRDRLMCHTGAQREFNLGDPIVYVPRQSGMNIGYGSTAGPLLDRHDGCPFAVQSIYEHDTNRWRPVSVAAGQDSDAFDHLTALIHSAEMIDHGANTGPNNGYVEFPVVEVPLVIRDDDEWEQGLEFSIDDGASWTSIQDGGLSLAFPRSLDTGRKAHYFWVRLTNDPPADQNKRIHLTAHFANQAPLNTGTTEYFRSYRVWLTSPAADHLHTFRSYPETGAAGSATVSRTPIQIEINVGDNFAGTVTFDFEAFKLYERSDNQISTQTPPVTVRTKNFSFYRTLGACVGCQRLLGDLPDPVVERVGDLSYANLSDSGIDLSWPRVVGAEGYEVRYWSTTSPFPGIPAEEAWFGAEPNDPAWNIRHLEPDTEYRAVVYYQDHGATQLSTASPVIRFTTLPAGSPVQAEPTSVVVERVPEVSISAASGTINEGEDASFTVTVEPAPDAPLTVRVHVRGPSGGSVVDGTQLGARTVTVGTSGSASFPIPTVDDTHWRSNGMLGASVMFGEGYRQSKFRSHASVYIANNDLPPPPAVQLKRISDSSLTVAWRPQADGTTYTVGWHESFSGIPVPQEVTTTETEHQITGLSPRSHYVVYVLAGAVNLGQLHVRALAAGAPPRTFEVNFDRPAPTPVVSVTADGDLTEGQDASFTVTANPAPEADLDVTLTVSASGDYGAATGPRTVTIPAAGFATLTVATTNDQIEEEDGSLTVTIDPGEAYLVSTTQGSATAAVADDDTAYVVDPGVIVKVKQLASQTQHGSAHVNRWQRVLVAFGEHEGTGVTGGPMTAAEAQQMADAHSSPVWDLVVAELTALEASQQAPTPTPEVNITSAAGGSEGDSVSFTLTASPAPASALTVSVTAVTSGDFGFGALPSSVVIPTSGSATVTITTTDDQTDEPDGSVTLTVNSGSDYTVGALSSQTAGVADDDDPPVPEQTGYTVDPAVVTKVQTLAAQTQHGAAHVNRWQRVLVAFGEHDGTGVAGGAMTAAEAQQMANSYSSPVWDEVVTELTALEAAAQQTPPPPPPPPPPPTPEVNITSASDGSEGGSVSFTLTATPAPAADLPVTVTISVSGDYGVTAGSRTVTIPASGSATLTLATTDDQTDEPDGSVTATLATGSGYTIGSLSAQTAAVADDDDPPVPELVVTPVVSITGGSAITEGGSASFTISANPSPTADIDVTVTVTQSGDFGASTGQRTVRITSGQTSQTFTVSTSDDSTDESDGSITVSLASGSGYTGSGSATVAVADNDDPPQPIEQADPPVDGDLPDVATLTACEGEPELLISSPAASRSDASVDFEVMLSCLPSGNPMILLVPVRDGIIGENLFISLTRDTPSTTVTVDIGGEAALGLAIGWQSGLAGSDVQGDVVFSD